MTHALRGGRALIGLTLATFLLSSCGTSEETDSPQDVPSTDDRDTSAAKVTDDTELMARVTSCSQVEALVAPYIENLVPDVDNGFDPQSGIYCAWDPPADLTDMRDNRSVTVDVGPGNVPPDPDMLERINMELVPSQQIESAGGIAYSTQANNAVAGVIVTNVVLPGAEVSITGGQWGDFPALDGPTATAIAVTLLGLD